jgi:hypothetical protein
MKKLIAMSLIISLLAGAFGALAKDLIVDNEVELPKKTNNKFFLGFIGGMLTGALAGILADVNPPIAFLAGFGGTTFFESLLSRGGSQVIEKELMEQIIRWVAKEEGVDPDLAVRVAKCENPNLDPKAVHINKDGSRDRGLFQVNDKWHPELSDEDAFDPIASTRFFCKAVKNGNLSWWNKTRSCWEKK